MYWVWRGSQCTGFGGEVNVLGLEGKSMYWVWRGIKDGCRGQELLRRLSNVSPVTVTAW